MMQTNPGSLSCCAISEENLNLKNISEENKRWNQSFGGCVYDLWRREGKKMVPAWQQKWLPGWPENA
jgi:predicted adenine nucleotide alpha hydrolase (AANH) superfamily ATPase